MANDFWSGRKVLITGADGFVGSHLTERLLSYGADVSVFVRGTSDMGTYENNFKNLKPVEGRLASIIAANIAGGDSVELIRKNSPEFIFHLAADAYVPKSFEQPMEVMETNLIGTLNILNAALKLDGMERIVCTSSSEVYGNPKYVPMDENHPLNPTHPYGASKAAADRYAFAYYNTYKLPIAIIRPSNTYGPRHIYDAPPKFISLALQNKPLTIYGDGKQTRDLVYVDDMVDAFIIMGQHKNAPGEVVNFGTGKETSILELARKIISISKSKSEIIFQEERPAEVYRLVFDCAKANKLFGWSPKIGVDEGLKRNIEWMKGVINE